MFYNYKQNFFQNKFDVVCSTCISLKAMCYNEFVSFQKDRLNQNATYDKEKDFEKNSRPTQVKTSHKSLFDFLLHLLAFCH